MTWAEDRRADRAAAREQARLDADAASVRRLAERRELVGLAAQESDRRSDLWADRWSAVSGWAGRHTVDLLIYPLALVSAAMAVPAMASYGRQVYGDVTGYVLPVLSELGMWAFELAVMVSRRRDPERPTGMLQAGTAVFAVVGATLNALHGLAHGGAITAVVMAVVSVAGVTAHQLVAAAPRRSRAERAARRLERLAARRVARARRAATRTAVVELAADGAASLVYAPGRYCPRRGRLTPATVPGLPVVPAGDLDGWDAGLAALAGSDPIRSGEAIEPISGADLRGSTPGPEGGPIGSGGVALLDPADRPDGSDRLADPIGSIGSPIEPGGRARLTPEEARAAAFRLARRTGRRVTAEALRTALRISPASARALRDEVNDVLYGGGGDGPAGVAG